MRIGGLGRYRSYRGVCSNSGLFWLSVYVIEGVRFCIVIVRGGKGARRFF